MQDFWTKLTNMPGCVETRMLHEEAQSTVLQVCAHIVRTPITYLFLQGIG